MNCIHCGETASFDRVVVDLTTHENVGCLCRDCEASLTELVRSGDPESPDCSLCRRRGQFALPQWEVLAWDDTGGEPLWLEHQMGPETPLLCETHYESLVPGAGAEKTGGAVPRATAGEVLNSP